MPLWHQVSAENVDVDGTKFSVQSRPFRFQIPKGAVLYNGLSEYKSITVQVSDAFSTWWHDTVEGLVPGLTPWNSNIRNNSLRIKVDKSTQIFNSKKEIQFPELKEGLFANCTVQCIVEVIGTYFFQGSYGLTCRAHQILVLDESESEEEETLRGFSFVLPDASAPPSQE